MRVRVVSNQWLGDQSHVAGECGGNLLIAVTPSRIAARPGDIVPFALEPRHLHIFGADGACIRHAEAVMTISASPSRDVIVGIDAGTSLIKTVAFTRDGQQLGGCSLPNRYCTAAGGRVEQDMSRTWNDTVAALRGLVAAIPDLMSRIAAIAVTGQGDGTWLIDDDGRPVAPACCGSTSRAAALVEEIRASETQCGALSTNRLRTQRLSAGAATGLAAGECAEHAGARDDRVPLQGLALFPAHRPARDRSVGSDVHLRRFPQARLRCRDRQADRHCRSDAACFPKWSTASR